MPPQRWNPRATDLSGWAVRAGFTILYGGETGPFA
jgi:hypothetical protein